LFKEVLKPRWIFLDLGCIAIMAENAGARNAFLRGAIRCLVVHRILAVVDHPLVVVHPGFHDELPRVSRTLRGQQPFVHRLRLNLS